MTTTTNGRRGPRHVAAPSNSDRIAQRVRRELAAKVNVLAHPNAKKSAARIGVNRRTIERRKNVDYCEHSPEYRMLEAIDAAEHPEALVEFLEVAHHRAAQRLKEKALEELVADYRKILAEDAENEGRDNSHKVCRGVDWLERCIGSVVDATDDRAKAAHELEFALRGLSESEVFS